MDKIPEVSSRNHSAETRGPNLLSISIERAAGKVISADSDEGGSRIRTANRAAALGTTVAWLSQSATLEGLSVQNTVLESRAGAGNARQTFPALPGPSFPRNVKAWHHAARISEICRRDFRRHCRTGSSARCFPRRGRGAGARRRTGKDSAETQHQW